ncbi:penicillin-binding transpeptidase domain-containing protein [Butyricicoccus sp.]|uniref:penicillin-binding transpeptidase domain-containing protein n=1 Tax=Butyricicoccus sp. TaxID=2049021 RepID=UPI003D7DEF6F
MDRHKKKLLNRLTVLTAGGLLCGLIVAANLFSLQVIHGDEYASKASQLYTYTNTIPASRGDILDRNGETLVSNKTVYKLCITYAFWEKDGQNDRILKLVNLIDADEGAEINDTLPISSGRRGSFAFTKDEDSSDYKSLQKFCAKQKWGKNLDADAIMSNLRTLYEVDGSLGAMDARKIVGIRYQMEQEQFSMYNSFTLATDISMDLVVRISEQQEKYAGVEVETSAEREVVSDVAANILGYTGPIFAEDWDKYKDSGYSMNAQVGKTGAEQAFEEYLRGTDGERAIQTDARGNVVSEEETKEAKSGNNVILTIDANLQKVAEQSLAQRCQSISGAKGGAAVVVDVRNGEILALANYPTYNLATFNKDYEKLAANKLTPLLNRSIAGTYAPGSTFKPVTAVAGLETGKITADTRIYDTGIYTYFKGYHPKCWIYNKTGRGHGWEDVTDALEDSCNYFFFETGRLVGGENLEKYAKAFGLGEYTGLELSGEKKGRAAGPTERAEAQKNDSSLRDWSGADSIQTAIGQGDNAFTPLQLANYCAAIANNGTQYEAHLLRSVKAYDYSDTVYTQEANVRNKIEAKDSTWKLVQQGMAKVTGEDGTASSVFANYSIKVAGKSGTAQISGTKLDNGIFISYAPYKDPQIAVCVVIEGGDSGNNVAPVVRDIYDAYFYSDKNGENGTSDGSTGTKDVGAYDVIA